MGKKQLFCIITVLLFISDLMPNCEGIETVVTNASEIPIKVKIENDVYCENKEQTIPAGEASAIWAGVTSNPACILDPFTLYSCTTQNVQLWLGEYKCTESGKSKVCNYEFGNVTLNKTNTPRNTLNDIFIESNDLSEEPTVDIKIIQPGTGLRSAIFSCTKKGCKRAS